MYIKKLTGPVVANLDEPVAQTKVGKVRGVLIDGTYMFRSIRYGQAMRFHMPEPAAPWEGIDACIIYKGVCPELDAPVPSDNFYVPHMFYRYSEDCLTLNIWTRSMSAAAKKPVMVWLHGGGFTMGSAIELYSYDGENLAAYGDVVVVTVNHRLNVLGYLDLSAYGDEYVNSGNVGMADIVTALEWIRDNIESFGGDSANVTIFGQSGGGGKVMTLMQMPAADGLYHKAVIQSAVAEGINMGSAEQETSRKVAARLLELAGLPRNAEGVSALERLPYDDLAKAANKVLAEMHIMGFEPVKNEYNLGGLMQGGFRAETLDVPVMIGTVFGEFTNNLAFTYGEGSKNRWSVRAKMEMLLDRFGASTDTIVEQFQKAYPDKNIADLLYIDTMFRRGTLRYAEDRSQKASGRVYNYLFTFEFSFNNGVIAFHNGEIPFVFHNADYLEAYYKPGATEKLQDQICSAWVYFAYTGNPNNRLIPHWDTVHDGNLSCMIFDETTRSACGHDQKLMDILPPSKWIIPKR